MSTQVNAVNKPKKIKKSAGSIAFTIINIIILTILSATFILPFINIIATSFSSAEAVNRGITFLPKGITTLWYEIVLGSAMINKHSYLLGKMDEDLKQYIMMRIITNIKGFEL